MTKNISSLIYISSLLFIISCERNLTNNKKLRTSNEIITYNTKFPTQEIQFFKEGQTEYISSIDYSTSKKISVNSINGEKKFDVDFKSVIENEKLSFNGYFPISIDTFALLSKYSNKVFLINKNGKVIFKKEYPRLFLEGVELYPPLYFNSGILRACIEVYYPYLDTLSKPASNHIRNLSEKLFIDSFFMKENYNTYLKMGNLYSRFTKDDEMSYEKCRFNFESNNILFHSIFSDSIYIFNREYKLKKAKQISSNKYDINLKPTKFNADKTNVKLSSKNAWYHTNFWKLLYDQHRDVFYCFIRGPYEESEFPFSIIVYDLEFNKLNERRFDKDIYKPNGFVGKKGLYIELHGENEMKEKEFEIFNYE